MNRALRTLVITAAVGIGAAVCAPAAASAATADPPVGQFALLSPGVASRVAPGQVYTGIADVPQVAEGDEIRLVGAPVVSGSIDVCGDGVLLGRGTVGAGKTIEITATGTLPDGLSMINLCHSTVTTGLAYIMDNPFELSSPTPDTALPVDAPLVRGVGSPGATVTALGPDDTPWGTAVVGADGAWALTLTGIAQGPATIHFTQGAKSFDADIVVVESAEGTPLVDPLLGGPLVVAGAGMALALGLLAARRRRTVPSA